MRISVSEAIASGRLTGVTLVAGRGGLHRVVKRLAVLEELDASLIERGDLVVLDLAAEEDRLAGFLTQAAEREPAAFMVRHHLATAATRAAAEARDLPLLQVREETAWRRVIAGAQRDLLLTQIEIYERVQEIHATLTRAVVQGQGIKEIARVLANLIGNPVVIENERYEVLASDNGGGRPDPVRERTVADLHAPDHVLEVLARDGVLARISSQRTAFRVAPVPELEMQARVMAPIRVGNIRYGHISIQESNQPLGELDLMAVEQAAALAALQFSLQRVVRERKQRLEENLVFDLLFGEERDKAVITQRASFLGHAIANRYVVLVVDVDDFGTVVEARQLNETAIQEMKDGIRYQIRNSLRQRNSAAFVAGRGDATIVLYPLAEGDTLDKVRGYAHRLQTQLLAVMPELTFSFGIGRFCEAIKELGQSYQDAQMALAVGKDVTGSQSILAYDELGVYSLFTNYQDTGVLGHFLNRTVGRLYVYDKEHSGELVKTLQAYFRNGRNKQQTADELFVHVNTVTYRLRLIERVTGADLANPEDVLELHLGLKIAALKRLRSSGGEGESHN